VGRVLRVKVCHEPSQIFYEETKESYVSCEEDRVSPDTALLFITKVVFIRGHLSRDHYPAKLVLAKHVVNLIVTIHDRHIVHLRMEPIPLCLCYPGLFYGTVNWNSGPINFKC